jgi:hypothetical protein
MSKYRTDGKKAWMEKYLSSAEGCKVVGSGVRAGFPYLMLENDKGQRFRVEISSDEEGNDAGFLFGLPEVA